MAIGFAKNNELEKAFQFLDALIHERYTFGFPLRLVDEERYSYDTETDEGYEDEDEDDEDEDEYEYEEDDTDDFEEEEEEEEEEEVQDTNTLENAAGNQQEEQHQHNESHSTSQAKSKSITSNNTFCWYSPLIKFSSSEKELPLLRNRREIKVDVFQALIHACARRGDLEAAWHILQTMQQHAIPRTVATFNRYFATTWTVITELNIFIKL